MTNDQSSPNDQFFKIRIYDLNGYWKLGFEI